MHALIACYGRHRSGFNVSVHEMGRPVWPIVSDGVPISRPFTLELQKEEEEEEEGSSPAFLEPLVPLQQLPLQPQHEFNGNVRMALRVSLPFADNTTKAEAEKAEAHVGQCLLLLDCGVGHRSDIERATGLRCRP